MCGVLNKTGSHSISLSLLDIIRISHKFTYNNNTKQTHHTQEGKKKVLHEAAKNFPCLSFVVVVVVLHNFLMKYFEVIDGHCRETPFYVWSHTFLFLTMLASTTLSKSVPCLLLFAVVLLRVRAARERERAVCCISQIKFTHAVWNTF